jgi:hypothetical protein
MAGRGRRTRRAPERSVSDEEQVKEAWRRECIGANIGNARRAGGLPMRRLATRAGLSVAYLSDVERATRNVSCDFLVRVAYYPGESAKSLFSE